MAGSEGSLFITLNYKGTGKLLVVNRHITRQELLQQATMEWSSIKTNQVYLTSTAGSLENCSLKTDQDMVNLLLFCNQFQVKHATVNLFDIRKETITNLQRLHPFTSSTTTAHSTPINRAIGNNDEFVGSGSIPSYNVAPQLEKIPLLSDGWRKLIQGNGQLFKGGAVEFREKIVKYTSKIGFGFDYNRNDPRYVHVVCTERVLHECGWFIKAGRQPHNNYFAINQCHLTHKCVGKLVGKKRSRLWAAILGKMFTDNIRQNPTVKPKDVKLALKMSYGVDVDYSRAHRTVSFSKGEIYGTYKDSYNNLPWYNLAVERTNPGSITRLERERKSNHFKRNFVAFKASLEAFKTCRPMLFIDGTFASGRAWGTILAATAKDGNNGLVPVAFAVVSCENLDNWQWFLEMIRDHVKHDKEIFYISDRHAGLMSAFPKVFDKPVHFFCLQHLKNNLQMLFGGKGCGVRRERMWDLFKEVAYAPTEFMFDQKMATFKDEGGVCAAEWIDTLPVEKWAVAHSSHIMRYGEMTSNAIESFNFWIINARSLPVTYMIDTIRMGLMRWFVERREEGNKWKGALCQHKEEHWNALVEMGSTWNVLEGLNSEYEVLCGTTSVNVNLKSRKCSCYQWQIRGFPCAHAVAVIRKACNNITEVIDAHFFVATYRKCYSWDFHPIPQTEKFECLPLLANEPPVLPPSNDSTLGRPTLKRKKGCFEKRLKKKAAECPKCGLITRHDAFTCGLSNKLLD